MNDNEGKETTTNVSFISDPEPSSEIWKTSFESIMENGC